MDARSLKPLHITIHKQKSVRKITLEAIFLSLSRSQIAIWESPRACGKPTAARSLPQSSINSSHSDYSKLGSHGYVKLDEVELPVRVCHSATAMVSFIAMTRRKTKTETKRKSEAVAKRKVKIVAVLAPKEAGHSPEATATNKKAVLVGLGLGMGPGEVAEAIGIGRSTVFGWKRDDPEFSAKWNEARETAWDKLEVDSTISACLVK